MRIKRSLFVVFICFNIGVTVFLVTSRSFPQHNTTANPQSTPHVDYNISLEGNLQQYQYAGDDKKCLGKFYDFTGQLNMEQKAAVNSCIASFLYDSEDGLRKERKNRDLRYNSHKYLSKTNVLMIEVGGHLGLDANEFNSRYHPETYIVLEPVLKFYEHLKQRFSQSLNMVFLNYGLDVEDGEFSVDSSFNDGTSLYKNKTSNSQNQDKIKVMSVSKFFDKMKIDVRDIDLLTMNCEGCEYAVLDYLLSSGKIQRVKNIQFQSHRLPGICRPVERFCWYQQLLPKSHKLVYQFKFWWESWTRV